MEKKPRGGPGGVHSFTNSPLRVRGSCSKDNSACDCRCRTSEKRKDNLNKTSDCASSQVSLATFILKALRTPDWSLTPSSVLHWRCFTKGEQLKPRCFVLALFSLMRFQVELLLFFYSTVQRLRGSNSNILGTCPHLRWVFSVLIDCQSISLVGGRAEFDCDS